MSEETSTITLCQAHTIGPNSQYTCNTKAEISPESDQSLTSNMPSTLQSPLIFNDYECGHVLQAF